jgi:hypothetical protein
MPSEPAKKHAQKRPPPERQVELMRLGDVQPYDRNARTHSEEQIAQIAASIAEFGFTNPILIDEAGRIIAGHGRLAAAQSLGLEAVPAIRLEGLSDAQVRALTIADNQLALNAGWDATILGEELARLNADGFALDLLGFDDTALSAFLANEDVCREPKVSPIPQAAVEQAWRQWAGELAAQVRACAAVGYARQGVTPGFALKHFLSALHENEEYPRHAVSAFHANLYRIAGDAESILDGLDGVAEGRINFERLRFVCDDVMEARRVLGAPLPFAAARVPADFPAELARDLIDEFAPGGSVVDPCHGWGGRLVGFLLSSARIYAGTDPSPETAAGVVAIRDLFLPHVPDEKDVELAALPMESWNPSGKAYDLALTSPPYFDVEKYEGEEQSHSTYSDYEAWRDGFYRALLDRVWNWLRPGGVFVLQIGSQRYPLLKDGKMLARKVGFAIESVRASGMVNNAQETTAIDGEVVIVLRKPDVVK